MDGDHHGRYLRRVGDVPDATARPHCWGGGGDARGGGFDRGFDLMGAFWKDFFKIDWATGRHVSRKGWAAFRFGTAAMVFNSLVVRGIVG